MKKPQARGPTPSEKAKKSLDEKLNRPPKPPPAPNDLPPPPDRPIKGEQI
ncbi:MAG TPA: hypothetical protein VGI85_15705 [Chthoniobacterales bacterium]